MPSPVNALPPDAILLHIGPHKTGTTAIQSSLARAREELLEHDTTYPGESGAHHHPARAVCRHAFGWPDDNEPAPPIGAWHALVEKAHAASGRVVISSEFLAYADAAARAQVLDDLGRDRVHVVVGARNPGALAVSSWQQTVREGVPQTLDEWLEERFRRSDTTPAEPSGPWYDRFWAWADPAVLARQWAESAGADNVSVLVIDPSDREQLPRAFEQLLGLPDGLLIGHPDRSNRSLTAPEMELLLGVVERVRDQVSWGEYSTFVRGGMLLRLVESRRPTTGEPRLALPAWAAAQSAEEARRGAEWLAASGLRVIGDPHALTATPGPSDDPSQEASDQIPTDLAAEAIAGTVIVAAARSRRLKRRAASLKKRVLEARAAAARAGTPPAGASSGGQPATQRSEQRRGLAARLGARRGSAS